MNIFIYGYGSIGKRHIRIIKEIYPNYNIFVVRHSINKNNNNYDKSCEKLVNKFFYNYEEAIDYMIPDIAFICNPAPYHIDVALKLAEKNVNLFIEKPISNKIKKVQDLINICKKKNITLQVGYMTRYSDSLNKIREFLLQKKYGQVFSFRCSHTSYLPNWRKSWDYSKDVTAISKLGGGVILELSHEIDYIKWLFGNITDINSRYGKLSNLNIDVEDYLDILFTAGKIPGTLHINMSSRYIERKCIINCELATIIWDGNNFSINIIFDDNEEIIEFTETRDDLFKKQIIDFFLKVNKKDETFVTGKDGLYILEIIEKIKYD